MARITVTDDELSYILSKISGNTNLIEKINSQIKQSDSFYVQRKKSMIEANTIKSEISKNKVFKAIETVLKNNEALTGVNIMKYCDVSKNTAHKYLKEYKKENNLT